MSSSADRPFTLEDLERIVALRASSGDASSYTAKLAAKGVAKTAKKLGEEAVVGGRGVGGVGHVSPWARDRTGAA